MTLWSSDKHYWRIRWLLLACIFFIEGPAQTSEWANSFGLRLFFVQGGSSRKLENEFNRDKLVSTFIHVLLWIINVNYGGYPLISSSNDDVNLWNFDLPKVMIIPRISLFELLNARNRTVALYCNFRVFPILYSWTVTVSSFICLGGRPFVCSRLWFFIFRHVYQRLGKWTSM